MGEFRSLWGVMSSHWYVVEVSPLGIALMTNGFAVAVRNEASV
jgi:hypothetical protein